MERPYEPAADLPLTQGGLPLIHLPQQFIGGIAVRVRCVDLTLDASFALPMG